MICKVVPDDPDFFSVISSIYVHSVILLSACLNYNNYIDCVPFSYGLCMCKHQSNCSYYITLLTVCIPILICIILMTHTKFFYCILILGNPFITIIPKNIIWLDYWELPIGLLVFGDVQACFYGF